MSLHPDIERVALIGWHVYPASSRSKAACLKGPTGAATCDLDQLERWSHEFPRCNWRVVCGPSGVWGLDCDVPPGHAYDGVAGLAALTKIHGPLPARPQLRSGGGGVALFFRHDGERLVGDAGNPSPGIDPRRGRQSQTIPPSRHIVTGKSYRWITAPWDLAPPPAPAWLLRLLEPPPEPEYRHAPIDTADFARNRLYRAATAVTQASSGARNDTLNRRSYQVGRLIGAGLLGEQEALEVLYSAARVAGLDHGEAKATIRSGVQSGVRGGGG